jgi:hypothetical protein
VREAELGLSLGDSRRLLGWGEIGT